MEVFFYISPSGRSPIEEFIGSLPKHDQARFRDVFVGICEYGLDCPRVQFRQLRGKLWEIKFRSSVTAFRIAYVVVEKHKMIWLHVFKKSSQRTRSLDLNLAEKRMREVS
jgi:phage-related protein